MSRSHNEHKKDEVLQEYKKARWYIDELIKYLEDNNCEN